AVLEEAAEESDHADRADDDEDEAKSGQRHRGEWRARARRQTREFDDRVGAFGATSVGTGFKKPTQERRRKEVGVDGEEHEASDLGEDPRKPLKVKGEGGRRRPRRSRRQTPERKDELEDAIYDDG
ncbi:hypothetical protein V490_03981, partial [Pseudogymnoascus sp. VKM F-3557]